MMPACEPVYDAALQPRALMAIASSDMAMRSPAVSSMSSSRGFGTGAICFAIASRSSVVSPMAETATRTSNPSSLARTTRSATAWIRSVVPTEVPPYFCTMMGTLSGPPLAIRASVAAASGRIGQPQRVTEEPHLEQEQVLGRPPAGVMWVTPDSGSTWWGGPPPAAPTTAAGCARRRRCRRPVRASAGAGASGSRASSSSRYRAYASASVSGIAQVALRVVGVVERASR